jgi:hypothetical protein
MSSIQLQPRDFATLRGLFESRIMTSRHITVLYFNGREAYAIKRLRKLKAAGLIGQRRRQVNQKAVHFLTRKGFLLLRREDSLSDFPHLSAASFEIRAKLSEMTIRHELEVMDSVAAFHIGISTSDKFSIRKCHTWPKLYEFNISVNGHGREVKMKPDGYLSIHEKEVAGNGYAHDFFIELDRSTETQDVLVEKAKAYREYYRSGGFAVHNGGSSLRFEEFPFRVLMVLKTSERRNNTTHRLLQQNPPILTHVWLTTLAELVKNPSGAIWVRPQDYRDAVKNTPFETQDFGKLLAYSRQQEREILVESKVQKQQLFFN